MKDKSEHEQDNLADDIVASNDVFQDESLRGTLARWVEVRDAVDRKYPDRSEMAKSELIGRIMKRLKLTNISRKL